MDIEWAVNALFGLVCAFFWDTMRKQDLRLNKLEAAHLALLEKLGENVASKVDLQAVTAELHGIRQEMSNLSKFVYTGGK